MSWCRRPDLEPRTAAMFVRAAGDGDAGSVGRPGFDQLAFEVMMKHCKRSRTSRTSQDRSSTPRRHRTLTAVDLG